METRTLRKQQLLHVGRASSRCMTDADPLRWLRCEQGREQLRSERFAERRTIRPRSPLLARVRRRQRGASFVEGLAVVLTIGLFLAISSWFHSVYRTKGETMALARLDAWQRARAGCRMVAGETLFGEHAQRASIAPGNGAFPDGLELQTRSILTCNEPPAGDEPSLAAALDSLHEVVPGQAEQMERWLFGSSQPFAGLIGPLEFLGRSLNFAVREVSTARDAIADRLGEALAWTERSTTAAFEWMERLD